MALREHQAPRATEDRNGLTAGRATTCSWSPASSGRRAASPTCRISSGSSRLRRLPEGDRAGGRHLDRGRPVLLMSVVRRGRRRRGFQGHLHKQTDCFPARQRFRLATSPSAVRRVAGKRVANPFKCGSSWSLSRLIRDVGIRSAGPGRYPSASSGGAEDLSIVGWPAVAPHADLPVRGAHLSYLNKTLSMLTD
jgi:hypothetical protein